MQARRLRVRQRTVRRRVSLDDLRDLSPEAIERKYGIPMEAVGTLFEQWDAPA